MPRTARIAPGGMIFHVLNRANNRDEIFERDEDYLAFLRVMRDTLAKKPKRILSFCLVPNHWHIRIRRLAKAYRQASRLGVNIPLSWTAKEDVIPRQL